MKKNPSNSLECAWNCRKSVVVLSPHLDDAALSVGASIASLVESGTRVTVLTLFAGCPKARTKLVSETLSLWKVDTYETRREEDLCAMSILGCDHIHCDHPEALFRHASAGSMEEVIASDCCCQACKTVAAKLVGELPVLLSVLDPALMLLPAGDGFHIDHEITSKAGRAAAQEMKLAVLSYEELPYACKSSPLRPGRQGFTERHMLRKLRAVEEYRSQIPSLEYAFGKIPSLLPERAAFLATPAEQFAELVFR